MQQFKWPFAIYRLKDFFIIHLNLFLIIFSQLLSFLVITLLQRPSCCLFSNCHYKFPSFFSVLQFYQDSQPILDALTKSIPYCVDVVIGICQICCLGSSAYFLPSFCIPSFFILHSGIMLPRFLVRFLFRSFRHSYSL